MKDHELIAGWVGRTANQVLRGRENYLRANLYEDLVQQGWVAALAALQSYDRELGSSKQSWIITSIKRDLLRYLDKEELAGMYFDDIDDLSDMDGVEELLDYETQDSVERKLELRDIAEILSEREAKILEGYYFWDFSEQMLAEEWGLSRSMIRKIKDRAMEKLTQSQG